MRIGIYFTSSKEQGGVYQYSTQVLGSLSKIKGHEYIILSTSSDVPQKFIKHKQFKVIDVNTVSRDTFLKVRNYMSTWQHLAVGFFVKALYRLRLFNFLTPFYKYSQSHLIKTIESQKLDLVFYPTSSDLSFLSDVPAVVTVHDLQHRLNPLFKEVSAGGRWEYREYGFVNIAKKAFRIFVDSEIGKEDMVGFYPKAKNKTVVLPYLPPDYLSLRFTVGEKKKLERKLRLPESFIFYPSKFWPHKNHRNLIEALSLLGKRGRVVNLVLTGSKMADFSAYEEIMDMVKEKGLEDQVFYLGYVGDRELSFIYSKARALVMPTYFGPTNIPVQEAWKMGTPVVYSDIRGCREQLGDAGLLINPYDPHDIADKILKVYTSAALRRKLVSRGRKRLRLWTEKDFTKKVAEVIKDFEKESGKKQGNNKT